MAEQVEVVSAPRKSSSRRRMPTTTPTLGAPVEVDPVTALKHELYRTQGHVLWLAEMVAQLEHEAVVWDAAEHQEGFDGKGSVSMTTSTAEINAWVRLYQEERKRLVEVSAAAIRCGIAEREIQLMEQQGRLIASLLGRLIEDPDIGLDRHQREVARKVAARHLRALDPAS